jgi:hypothetical protein
VTPEGKLLSPLANRRRSRRSSAHRGYGQSHRAVRERLIPIVAGGTTECSRCGERIEPGQDWDLDHSDDRRGYLGPSHRKCNRRGRKVRLQSRQW